MEEDTLYLPTREKWREWLEQNWSEKKVIWLIYYKKHAKKPSIPYNDAVEEALCFGWIDSTVKRIDEERYMQKYTPRKDKSIWSKLNKKRVQRMIDQKRMTPIGMKKIRAAKENGMWTKLEEVDRAEVSPELEAALAENPRAKDNFYNFAPSYRKQYIWWITSAKRAETREKRIRETVDRAARNIKPGIQ